MRCFAWVKMIATFSQEDGLERAIQKTFDGQHPCHLCHAIQSAAEKESKRSENKAPSSSKDGFSFAKDYRPLEEVSFPRRTFMTGRFDWPERYEVLAKLAAEPLSPPPRILA